MFTNSIILEKHTGTCLYTNWWNKAAM